MMSKFKLLISAGAILATGFLAGRFFPAQEEGKELINGFAYLDALEKAADAVEEKVSSDGRLPQYYLNYYSGLLYTIREDLVKSLNSEIQLAKGFHLFEKEFNDDNRAWHASFEKETEKPSVYEGGTAASMEKGLRLSNLLNERAKILRAKWLRRIPVPYFEKPEPFTEEDLEAWRKLEEEVRSEAWDEEEIAP